MIGNVHRRAVRRLAYGSLLFLISVGLSVTMGLMNFVNLAHGAFAMLGGYVCVVLMTRVGVPFLRDAAARVRRRRRWSGVVLERTLYRRLYARQPPRPGAVLDRPRVHGDRGRDLLLRRVAAAGARCRRSCAARSHVLGLDLGAYRLFLIARGGRC